MDMKIDSGHQRDSEPRDLAKAIQRTRKDIPVDLSRLSKEYVTATVSARADQPHLLSHMRGSFDDACVDWIRVRAATQSTAVRMALDRLMLVDCNYNQHAVCGAEADIASAVLLHVSHHLPALARLTREISERLMERLHQCSPGSQSSRLHVILNKLLVDADLAPCEALCFEEICERLNSAINTMPIILPESGQLNGRFWAVHLFLHGELGCALFWPDGPWPDHALPQRRHLRSSLDPRWGHTSQTIGYGQGFGPYESPFETMMTMCPRVPGGVVHRVEVNPRQPLWQPNVASLSGSTIKRLAVLNRLNAQREVVLSPKDLSLYGALSSANLVNDGHHSWSECLEVLKSQGIAPYHRIQGSEILLPEEVTHRNWYLSHALRHLRWNFHAADRFK